MTNTIPVFRVNRAPVLTLWATVVAERLGHPPETALALGRFVAGSSARAKARRLGLAEEDQDTGERRARAADLKPRRETVRLLGRDIPVTRAEDDSLWVDEGGRPASAKSVRAYLARAFGERLAEVRAAMAGLASSFPPEELNRVGFRLYERFRPEVPEGPRGGGRRASCGSSGSGGRPREAHRPPIFVSALLPPSRPSDHVRASSGLDCRPPTFVRIRRQSVG